MIEIHKKDSPGGAVTVPPNIKTLRAEADAQVGVKMRITPELATEWLETRGNNRKVMQSTVDKYAQDMREGRWLFNGAPIQFDEEGKLLNGQHRLWSVIESGCPMDAVIQWGIPRDSQATIDAGQKWQAKDVLYMQGEKDTVLLQAVLRWVMREELGTILSSRTMSNSKAMELLERHPEVRHSCEFMRNLRGPVKPSVAVYLHYRAATADRDKANEFFTRLSDGVGLAETSPVYRLRERLMWRNEKLTQVDELALATIAWNYFRVGREMRILIWRRSGSNPMEFPRIEGAVQIAPPDAKPSKPKGRAIITKGGGLKQAKKTGNQDRVLSDQPGTRREVGNRVRVASHRRN